MPLAIYHCSHAETHILLYLDLAPDGVDTAASVTFSAVGSYPTLSPLPRKRGGLLSVALALKTILQSPSPDVIWHRVSEESGLSSL